jgi:hypothetical protein
VPHTRPPETAWTGTTYHPMTAQRWPSPSARGGMAAAAGEPCRKQASSSSDGADAVGLCRITGLEETEWVHALLSYQSSTFMRFISRKECMEDEGSVPSC